MSVYTKKRRKYAGLQCWCRLGSFSFDSSVPATASFSSAMSLYLLPHTPVSHDAALDDMQHRPSGAYSRATAVAAQLGPWKRAVEMLLLYGAVLMSSILLGSCQRVAQNHVSNDSTSSSDSTTDAANSVGISSFSGSRSGSIPSNFDNSRHGERRKYRPTTGRLALSPDRVQIPTANSGSPHLETTTLTRQEGSRIQTHAGQETARRTVPSKIVGEGSWRKLHSIKNRIGRHSFSQFRDQGIESVVTADVTVPVQSRTATVDCGVSLSSFLGTVAASTTSQPLLVPHPHVAATSAPFPVFSPPAPVVPTAAASQVISPPAVPLTKQSPAAPETRAAGASTIATPAVVAAGTSAVPTSVTPMTVTVPGPIAVSAVPTATQGVAPEAVVAPRPALPAHAGENGLLPMSTGEAPAATAGPALPAATFPTGAWNGGSLPFSGAYPVQPQPAAVLSPAGVPVLPASAESRILAPTRLYTEEKMLWPATRAAPLLPAARGSGATESANGRRLAGQGSAQQIQPVLQTEVHQQLQQQPQEGQIQVQQMHVEPRAVQQEVQKHEMPEQQLERTGEEAAVKIVTHAPPVPVFDRGTRVIPAGRFSILGSGGDTRRVCFDACECWPVWASSIAAFVLYSAATLVAVLLTASLFSRGLRSSSFYKGGGYWLLGATAAGAATGALIGALVARCVGAALGLAAGMMCLSASLVLLGSRGAWLGALGGVMTGGVIGAMTNGGATPIALGAGIGLLLGVICGFVPFARHLKINERYIRRGMTQGGAAPAASPFRAATKRVISRSHTTRSTKGQYGRLPEAGGSSSEDVRSLAVQRLSSNPVGRIRSSMGFAAAGALPSNRHRSIDSDTAPPFSGTARETDEAATTQHYDSVHEPGSIDSSAWGSTHAL